jgi:hypothetical protein
MMAIQTTYELFGHVLTDTQVMRSRLVMRVEDPLYLPIITFEYPRYPGSEEAEIWAAVEVGLRLEITDQLMMVNFQDMRTALLEKKADVCRDRGPEEVEGEWT